MNLNVTHQLLVRANEFNLRGGSVQTVTKNTEALVVANRRAGLAVNAGKTKCMVMSRDQNARRSHSM